MISLANSIGPRQIYWGGGSARRRDARSGASETTPSGPAPRPCRPRPASPPGNSWTSTSGPVQSGPGGEAAAWTLPGARRGSRRHRGGTGGGREAERGSGLAATPTSCNHSQALECSPWNSLGQNIGVGSLSLPQVVFPTHGLKPGLTHCSLILYQLSRKGSPEK